MTDDRNRKPNQESASDRRVGDEEDDDVVRRPRSRTARQQREDSEVRQLLRELGTDIDDVDSVARLRDDLDYVRRQRLKYQGRVSTIWTSVIAAAVSAVIGALGVLASNLFHTGKITP